MLWRRLSVPARPGGALHSLLLPPSPPPPPPPASAGGDVASAARAPPAPARPRPAPPRPRRARGAAHHDAPADDDFLNVFRPSHLLAAVAQERHDEGAHARAEHTSLAAAQAAAADHHRRDHVQLRADRDRWIALPEA